MNLRYVACPASPRWTAPGIPAQSITVNGGVGICIRFLLAFLRIIERYPDPQEAHATNRQVHPAVRCPTSVEADHRMWNIRFFEQSDFFFGQLDTH